MRHSTESLSPAIKLDNALAELHLLSHGTGFGSSLSSSPLASTSSEVASPVFSDYGTMNEQQLVNGKGYVPRLDSYKSEGESSLLSPLSSDYSSGRELYQTISVEKSDTSKASCTCCPYGKHQEEKYYKIRPSIDSSSRQFSSSSATDQISGSGSRSYRKDSGVSHTGSYSRRMYSIDSHGSDFSPESQISPLSTSSDPHNQRSRNVITKTTTTVTSSNILPASGENESLTISPEAIKQIKDHTDRSNTLIQELQEQLKLIPQLQGRIKSLKEDKRMLSHQLQSKSGVSTMRSIGVGDFDVDEDHLIVERIKQTVTQEAAKAPVRSVGVGVYDVNQQLYSQAEVVHTIAEHVQKIREKEIHSWIQEAENAYEARKASTRSFGVGDKDIRDEENRLIKEKEMRTILIGQQDKPSQRNVGLQVKPSMRDVCIEHSVQDTQPLTRTVAVNVDVGDIIQEMSLQSEGYGGLSQQQQQQNSWTMQKHVIQRKFIEAMTTGRQEDLVNFITGLLKKSVKSVGTTAKPTTAVQSTSTQFRTHDKGVGDDVTDVIVKPFVLTKDAFSVAKPATRTQPTWTDLLLSCDAGTNTQPYQHLVDRAVNTEPPPPESSQSEVTTIVTKRHVIPPPTTNKSSYYLDRSQITKALPTPYVADVNRTVTETTVSEHRATNIKPEVSRKYRSHVDKLMTPPPQPIDLDITLPQEMTAEERTLHREEQRRDVTRIPIDELHRTEMHMMLHGRAEPLSPVVVQMLPRVDSAEITSSTHTLLANSPKTSTSDTCLSSQSTSLVSEHQRGYSVRSRSLSGDRTHQTVSPVTILSPKSSSTKTVISEEKPYTTVKETTETTESGDTVKKERTIERTFSSSSKSVGTPPHMSASLSDFDYFGTNYSGSKPRGHAERMERYGGSVTYSSTGANVNEERNKTELHGNPLKSRYTIEEMSGGDTTAYSSQGSRSYSTKSLLRGKDSPRSKKIGVKFADEVDRSEYGSEFAAACTVLRQHIDSGSRVRSPQLAEAETIVIDKWFDTGCARLSSAEGLNSMFHYLSSEHSPILLELVINMADGNGNTALHYAISNANFDVMKALLQTGMVNVNVQNKAGYTPVMLAALCDAGNEKDRSALRLLLLNADVNVAASQAGQTALMLAVSHGRLEMVQLLVEANADVNLQDFDGSTALMCATEHNRIDIVKTLLAHPDIDVLLEEHDGSTALDIALEKGHEEVAEMLEKAEKSARVVQSTKERRSASRVIPSSPKGGNSHRASSMSSSRSYTSRFV